jgi:ABC-type multidrug transport system ATPase subunit
VAGGFALSANNGDLVITLLFSPNKMGDTKPSEGHHEASSLALLTTKTISYSQPHVVPNYAPNILSFTDFSCDVVTKATPEELQTTDSKLIRKQILKNVTGYAYSGEVLAILGSSGSGKTTLIDCLSMRKSIGSLSGQITLNGHTVVPALFKYLSAYVMQDDILMGALTTRESLTFAAKLRLPTATPAALALRVDELIKEMALERAADTRVGTEFQRGISGGEKKRLAIALQLLADPLILFLDEPTTGLDAYNSFLVMDAVKRLAKKSGKMVCLSL